MSDYISRADAIKAVHKYFVDAFNNEPHEIDEDGDDVFTDMKSVNALLHHNKMVSKALKELPSADAVHGEWKFVDHEIFAGEYFCSICGKRAEVDLYGEWILSNFCPSCGVKMTPYKESEVE